MTGQTTVRPSASGRHQARRRLPQRGDAGPGRWLAALGVAVVTAAAALHLLPVLVALPLAGALVSVVGGGAGRPIERGSRTTAVAAAMAAGYAGVVVVLVLGAHLRRSATPTGAVLVAAVLAAGLALALPLALATGDDAAVQRHVTRPSLAMVTAGALTLTWAHLTGTGETALAAAALLLPLVLLGLRGWQATRGAAATRFAARPLHPDHRRQLAQAVNALVFWVLLAATALPGTYDALGRELPGGSTAVRVAVVAGAALGALTALVPGRQVLAVTNVFVAVCSLFLAAELVAAYRSPASPVALDPPFAGDWYVLDGGASALVNADRAVPGRHDAVEVTQLTRGRAYTGSGDRNADWNAFDAPILAPADGVVVAASDDLPDHPPGAPGTAHPAGNVVVVALDGGRYLEVSEVERGSVIVTVGTRVTRGQAIARVGDSGDATEPVLRVEVRDRADSRTYPIVFRHVTVVRGGVTGSPAAAWLRRGDRLHAEAW